MLSRMVGLFLMLGSAAYAAAQTTNATVTGFLTDTLSGRSGATALNVESAKRNVASGKAKYAIYDEKTQKLYILACVTPASAVPTFDDHRCVEQYLGQRVKITGTLSPTPLTRAGQSYAPDAVATPIKSDGNPDQSNTARMVSGDPTAPSGQGPARVQGHRKALDTSTPIAGVLTISSVEPAPIPA